jgi:WD40 repeat protein
VQLLTSITSGTLRERAIQIYPQYANAYQNRGNAKSALGDKKGAIADYDRAIQIRQKRYESYENRIDNQQRCCAIPLRQNAPTISNRSFRLVSTIDVPSKVRIAALSRDRQTLVTANGGSVTFWNLATGASKSLTLLDSQFANISALEMSPDGRTLITASSGIDIQSGVSRIDKCSGLSCEFSQTSSSFKMKFGSVIQLWDVDTGKAISVWGLSPDGTPTDVFAIDRMQVSNDGKSLSTHDTNGKIVTWQFPTGEKMQSVQDKYLVKNNSDRCTQSIAIHPISGTQYVRQYPLSIESIQPNIPKISLVLNLRGMARDRKFEETAQKYINGNCVTFSPDAKIIALSTGTTHTNNDRELYLWRTVNGTLLERLTSTSLDSLERGSAYSALAFSPDSQQLVAGTNGGTISLWNVGTGQKDTRYILGQNKWIYFLKFLDRQKIVVISDDKNGSKINVLAID